ncbi:MAG: radical SAM protein [Myxococcota bacterium]
MDFGLSRALEARRADERGPGTRTKDAPLHVGLLYPSPYRAAMSSLGFLQIHRLLAGRQGTRVERATLPDPEDLERYRRTRTPLFTIESQRPLSEVHAIGISHAYELELAGLATCFELAGIPPRAVDRSAAHPLVFAGGPITFSNPLPTSAFADVMLLGEAEETLGQLLDRLERTPEAARGDDAARRRLLEDLAGLPGFYVPQHHGRRLPKIAAATQHLPAVSSIWTPHTELHHMLLIEPERGCHRGCTFCVMRRTTNGGMRLFEVERVLAALPEGETPPRVGLVGAAVSDHPALIPLLRALVEERGFEIGISSLRADRLDDELVGLLAKGGYRSMTVALDAASERLRVEIEKNLPNRHVVRAAELARAHGMRHLKVYAMLGLPGETEADLDELIQFSLELRKILPVKLGVSPFVPKFHTPLANAPFAGEAHNGALLERLKRRLSGKVEVRGPSAREAWVEYRLAQGGPEHADAAIAAAASGGSLGAWRRALKDLPERSLPTNFEELIPMSSRQRRLMVTAPRAEAS